MLFFLLLSLLLHRYDLLLDLEKFIELLLRLFYVDFSLEWVILAGNLVLQVLYLYIDSTNLGGSEQKSNQ